MKFQTTAGLLTKALTAAGGVIERRSAIPVLDCVKFDGKSITSTDLDMEMSIAIPAAEASGKACIAHRALAGLVRHIPADETVTIRSGDSEAEVSFSSGRYTLPCLPANDFPDLVIGEQSEVDIDADQFRKALAFVSPFISTEETRYYLNGAFMDGDVAVATNGHRLGRAPLGMDCGPLSGGIIPAKAVKLIRKLSVSRATANRDKPSAVFQSAGATLRTRLIDGTFPDYRKVIPEDADATSRIMMGKKPLLNALNRLSGLRGDLWCSAPGAALAWDDDRLVLVAGKYVKQGKALEFLPATASGKGLVGFNVAYLRDILRVLSGDEVSFMVKDASSPIVFRGDDDSLALLMPMRSADEDAAKEALGEMAAAEVGRAA